MSYINACHWFEVPNLTGIPLTEKYRSLATVLGDELPVSADQMAALRALRESHFWAQEARRMAERR